MAVITARPASRIAAGAAGPAPAEFLAVLTLAYSTGVQPLDGATPTNLRLFLPHLLRPRPWTKPWRPPTFEQSRRWIANAQTEDIAREIYDGLVCESGRYVWEMALSAPKLSKATIVDFAAVTTPVLVMGGECDRLIPFGVVRRTAARYQHRTSVEIPRSDHMVFSGEALPVTMGHIDDWIARNHVLAIA